jgi:hypothetical protein
VRDLEGMHVVLAERSDDLIAKQLPRSPVFD